MDNLSMKSLSLFLILFEFSVVNRVTKEEVCFFFWSKRWRRAWAETSRRSPTVRLCALCRDFSLVDEHGDMKQEVYNLAA